MGELLSWVGNIVNYSILIYFYFQFVGNPEEILDLWIATAGLIIGILIQIRNISEKW